MFPYIILIVIPFLIALDEALTRKGKSQIIVGLIFSIFVLIVGLTDGNGLDWYGTSTTEGYGLIDYRAEGFDNLNRFEPGFVLVNIILGDFHLFLFVISVICFLLVWKVIKYECKYKYIGLFVFLSTMSLYCYMGVYRHAIAQTLVIYSWLFIDKPKKQLFFILLAITFHYSAFICLLYLVISKIGKVLSLKLILCIVLIGILVRPYLLPIFQFISFFMPGETAGKLDSYINSDDFEYSFSLSLFIFRLFIYIMAYICIDNSKRRNCFYLNSYAISIILYCVICFSPTFARLVMFFACTEIIIVPLTVYYLKEKKTIIYLTYQVQMCFFLIVSMLYMYMYFKSIIENPDTYLPYKSILFQ